MLDFRARLSDPGLLRFYDCWASLCRDRSMPARKDLDVTELAPACLPALMLVDVFHDPRRYRYRLIGTGVVAASGEDRTGRFFDDVSFFKLHPAVMQQYETVVATGQPLHSLEPFTNLRNGALYEVDRLLLPLSSDGRLVDMLIVFFQFKSGPYAKRLSA